MEFTATPSHYPPFSRRKWFKIVAYVLAMGVCGLVLVALGSTLEFLAGEVNTHATAIGSVFLARGAGSITGAVVSAKLFRWYSGNAVLTASLVLLMVLLAVLPYNESIALLHAYFFLLGLGTAVTDTGCQLMTRKLHGARAGPWLGLNATVFGLSAAFVPLLELVASDTYGQYTMLVVIVALAAAFMLIAALQGRGAGAAAAATMLLPGTRPTAGSDRSPIAGAASEDEHDRAQGFVPHFYTEVCIAVMLFCFVGGSIAATAYFETYVSETGVVEPRQRSHVVFVLWLSITLGRFFGVQDQIALSDFGLTVDLSIFCVGGSLAMALIYAYPTSPAALWVGTALYGFFHGPTVGFCQDLNNRLTLPTETSMAIVMFGLNVGASVVPYLTALLWSHQGSHPSVLIVIVGLSMLVPLPLLFLSKRVSYHKSESAAAAVRSAERGRPRRLTFQTYESVGITESLYDMPSLAESGGSGEADTDADPNVAVVRTAATAPQSPTPSNVLPRQ